MTKLSDFSDEEIDLIVSLPYKVGVSVSYADDEEGEIDDLREMRALETSIIEASKRHSNMGLTQEVASEILSSKDKWDLWAKQGVFNIEPLCEKVVVVLKSKADDDEVLSYVEMVVELATTVAQAYGEFGQDDQGEKGLLGVLVSKISKIFDNGTNHPMNVSASENDVISSISAALKKNL